MSCLPSCEYRNPCEWNAPATKISTHCILCTGVFGSMGLAFNLAFPGLYEGVQTLSLGAIAISNLVTGTYFCCNLNAFENISGQLAENENKYLLQARVVDDLTHQVKGLEKVMAKNKENNTQEIIALSERLDKKAMQHIYVPSVEGFAELKDKYNI